MKKKILGLGVTLVLCLGTSNVNAQAFEQGNVLIDVYSGGPNLYTSVAKAAYANSGTEENIKIGGVPTLGGRFGYMVSDKISVGIDFNYTSTKLTYDESTGSTTYNYKLTIPRIKAMARFEFHFGNSDKFDFYWPVAVGYKKTSVNFTSTDPDYEPESVSATLIPVAFRSGIGGRYFFTENIGLNMEFGLGGGPIIEGGLAIKF